MYKVRFELRYLFYLKKGCLFIFLVMLNWFEFVVSYSQKF